MTHVPDDKTRRTVETMAGYGISEDDIAFVLDITIPTLDKHYRRELRMGRIKANTKVAERLFQAATDRDSPNLTAMIWWEKTRTGLSEFAPWRSSYVGKKETALIEAQSAHTKDDEWAELVDPSTRAN